MDTKNEIPSTNEIPHPLFGLKKKVLPSSKFPTIQDVVNYVRFSMESKEKQSKSEKTEIFDNVAKRIVSIWEEAYVTVSIL